MTAATEESHGVSFRFRRAKYSLTGLGGCRNFIATCDSYARWHKMLTMKGTRRNIILTGFMATGKSAVGKALAARLGYAFVDVDTLIEGEAGMPISQIFAAQGENRFRAMESRMLEQAARRDACVIATGGGAILNPRNLEALKRSGVVIALTAKPETILKRLGTGEDRPMLWGGEKLERIRFLLAERAPAYAKADLSVDTTDRSIPQLVQHILAVVRAHRQTPPEGAS